jgi:LysR family glycine cleavage system transcriptional activator
MKKHLPSLNWLRSFEAAARHLSFTHAAEEINLTQAAVSQQVKGLESQLQTRLFKRLPRGLELTDAGLAYLPVVREAFEKLGAGTEEIFGQERSKLLTVKVNLVFFTTWLAPRLSKFRALHPEVKLRFTSNIWIHERDGGTDADMEIRYGHGAGKGEESHRLTWDQLIPVCSPLLLQGSQPLHCIDDLRHHTLLHVIGYEEGWGYWLNQTGNGQIDFSPELQFDTLITALEVAANGDGLALGRSSLVEGMLRSGRLIAPFTETLAAEEAFHLVYSSDRFSHPHSALFRSWLVQEAQDSKQTG